MVDRRSKLIAGRAIENDKAIMKMRGNACLDVSSLLNQFGVRSLESPLNMLGEQLNFDA